MLEDGLVCGHSREDRKMHNFSELLENAGETDVWNIK
jgi:hypothetical protein